MKDHGRLPLVLQIGIKYASGGEGRVYSELCKFLTPAGIDVVGVVSGPNDVSSRTNGKILAFAPDGADMKTRLLGARATIRKLLQEKSPDFVASHFALYTAPAVDLFGKLPKVTHFHGPWAAESKQEGANALATFAKLQVEQLVYRRADRVIVLSKAFAELAASRYGIARERIRIVPGSVDVARFATQGSRLDARTRLNLPLDRPLLLSVRRLVQRMGLSQLIEAMKVISVRVPDVLLCIAGQGPLRESLEQQVKEAELTKFVRFLGFIEDEDLPYLYQAADINVVPTLALEGFGLVAAEAMAAGTPSMVTPVGGLPEVVMGLSPDLVFISSSAADLAHGLVGALTGEVKLPGDAACREYVNTHFTSALMASRTADVYRELL